MDVSPYPNNIRSKNKMFIDLGLIGKNLIILEYTNYNIKDLDIVIEHFKKQLDKYINNNVSFNDDT